MLARKACPEAVEQDRLARFQAGRGLSSSFSFAGGLRSPISSLLQNIGNEGPNQMQNGDGASHYNPLYPINPTSTELNISTDLGG